MQKPAGYSSLRRFGDFKDSIRPADHDGWVLVDGRTLLRSSYPRFFDALGMTADSLKLPDAKDCIFVGAGARLQVLERGGSNEVTLSIDNLPAHDHGYEDSYAEAKTAQGGLLGGLVQVFTGLAAKTSLKTTGKAGAAKPVTIAPLAVGTNKFIYVGEPAK